MRWRGGLAPSCAADRRQSARQPVSQFRRISFVTRIARPSFDYEERRKMSKRLTAALGTLVLSMALSVFAGSALAGNGNGQGNGNANANGNATANNGKSDDQGASTQGSANAATSQQSTQKGSAAQNANASSGVKPTNATAKGTTCSTGGGTGSSATCTA